MGVTKQGNKYRARIWRNNKNLSLGTFATEAEAWAAVNKYKVLEKNPAKKIVEQKGKPSIFQRIINAITYNKK